MNLSSFNFLTKEGVKNIWVNRLMSIASVGVLVACMVLIGLASLLSLNVNKIMGELEDENVIMAYFDDYSNARYSPDLNSKTPLDGETVDANGVADSFYTVHNEEEAMKVCEELRKIDNVDTVEYVSSEQGLESIKGSLLNGDEQHFAFLDEDGGNPLPSAAKITMKDLSRFDDTVNSINAVSGIASLQSQRDIVKKVDAISHGIKVAGMWIIVILMIIALVIVSNTIRVTMYTRKLEISIMKAVGATDAFIRLPFVVEGILIGLISAIISEGILYAVYRIATESILGNIADASLIPFSSEALPILLLFAVIGVVAGSLGSIIMIGKYLRKEGSEFSAI